MTAVRRRHCCALEYSGKAVVSSVGGFPAVTVMSVPILRFHMLSALEGPVAARQRCTWTWWAGGQQSQPAGPWTGAGVLVAGLADGGPWARSCRRRARPAGVGRASQGHAAPGPGGGGAAALGGQGQTRDRPGPPAARPVSPQLTPRPTFPNGTTPPTLPHALKITRRRRAPRESGGDKDRRCNMCTLLWSPRRPGCRHVGADGHPLSETKRFGKQTPASPLGSPHRLPLQAVHSVIV